VPARVLVALLLSAGVLSATQGSVVPLSQWLWDSWPARRVLEQSPPCVRPADLGAAIATLAEHHGERLRVEEVGRSVEGRPLRLLVLGSGAERILLFSQMHGDEPSATPALLDLVDLLLSATGRPELERILDRFTLLVLPMVNPDGAELYQRRNAQGIDINRDALDLATPEGRALAAVRERYQPILAFNLHDQDRRTVLEGTGRLSTIAVLAVSGDRAQTITPGRERAMRVCSAIVRALAPFVGESIARYDEDWSPRAFGDNFTAWGTPTVLLESGGLTPGRDLEELARLDYVALLVVLAGLAENDLAGYDHRDYQELPRTAPNGWADVVVRGGRILQPPGDEPYSADLAFDLPRTDRLDARCPGATAPERVATLVEIGDARFLGAGRTVDASGRLVTPSLRASVAGIGARRWLDARALERLGRHGVAVVTWRVPAARLVEARDLAASLAGPGRARLEPTVHHPGTGHIPLGAAPGEPPPGATLGQLVESLAGTRRSRPQREPEARAALRPGAPASFLVLVPRPDRGDEAAEPWEARLESVWLDGVEHRALPADG
jgi:hypothetical protein